MEVRKGYKQTEVGVIPEDWDVLPVSNFGETKRGAGSLSIKYKNMGGVRLIRINDFFQDNPVFVEPTDDIMRFKIHERDLLFAGTGASAGASYLPKKEWIGLPHSYNAPRIRVFENNNKEYLLYSLKSDYVRKQQKAWFVGNAQPFLDTKAISSFSIATPPTLAEQEAIAEALSDADAFIEAVEQLLAKKRQVKQGAMSELLTGKRRLAGFSGEWEVRTIGEIGYKFLNGGTPSTKKEEYWEGNIPWITGADFIDQKVADIRRVITTEAVNNSATNVIEKGNLLVVTRTGVGKIAIAPFDLAISQDITGIYVKKEYVLPEFLFWYFYYSTGSLRNLNQGTSISGITRDTLTSLSISLPSLAEQTAIAEILSDMDAEISALEEKLVKARQVKAGMMSELLTGKIRLV